MWRFGNQLILHEDWEVQMISAPTARAEFLKDTLANLETKLLRYQRKVEEVQTHMEVLRREIAKGASQ